MLERSREVKRRAVLYADRRLGGVEQWVYGPEPGAGMRVPDEVKECVCYVCSKTDEKYSCGATAFFVSVPAESTDELSFVYVVTAKHNLAKVEARGSDVYLRVNLAAGGAKYIRVTADWHYPESGADAAVSLWEVSDEMRAGLSFRVLPAATFATHAVIQKEHIGIGEDLLIPGLFTMRRGSQRNYPIVREGILSSMPDEPLQDADTGEDYEAYLAEVRSLGGLSGSPVFVVLHPGRMLLRSPMAIKVGEEMISIGPALYLLGLLRGHFDLREQAADLAARSEQELINTGIAIVTPIQEVETLLLSEELAKERRRTESAWKKRNAPTLD